MSDVIRYIPIPPDRVPDPDARSVWQCGNLTIALFNIQGTLYAVQDSCPHAGASLANGKVEGRTVQCPAHGLRFDLLTGCLQNAHTFGVRAYGVEIRDGQAHLILHEELSET